MKDREKYALASLLDYKKMKDISKISYIDEVKKARKLVDNMNFEQYQDDMRNALLVPDKNMLMSNSSAFQRLIGPNSYSRGFVDSNGIVSSSLKKTQIVGDADDVATPIKAIESQTPIPRFLANVLNNLKPEKKNIDAAAFKGFLKSNYKGIINDKQIDLIINSLSSGEIDLYELKDLFYKNSKKETAIEYILRITAKKLDSEE